MKKRQLSQGQKSLIETLEERLHATCSELMQIGDPVDVASYQKEEFSNLIGIFGPRGSGKSTLLGELCNKSKGNGERIRQESSAQPRLWLRPPLDCSTLPDTIAPGMAVLLHAFPRSEKDFLPVDLQESLHEIISTYIRLSKEHRELRQDLASSPGHFGKQVVTDVESVLTMVSTLAEWLKEALEESGKDAVVIPLDDFDLVPDREVIRTWINAFLNELHQPQLLFILAADYHRLEHIFADPEEGLDEATGRAQLDKLFPWRHRLALDTWTRGESLLFPDVDAGSTGSSKNLKVLLEEKLPSSVPREAMFALVPCWPRGLKNLYETLHQATQFTDDVNSLEELFALLAQSRQEPLLAKHLERSDLFDWHATLGYVAETEGDGQEMLAAEVWREMVKVAESRARARSYQSHNEVSDGDEKGRAGIKGFRQLSQLSSWWSREQMSRLSPDGVTWRMPDAEMSDIPTDVEKAAIPLWAECLLDLSFNAGEEFGCLNRSRFANVWKPSNERLSRAHFQISVSKSEIRRFLNDHTHLNLPAMLYWFDWSSSGDGLYQLKAGWAPLMSALRLQRSAFEPDEISTLGVNMRSIQGEMPSSDFGESLALIPDQVWAIVLWVDALHRSPWKAYSAVLGWTVPTYLLMAGALVQGAYLHAMSVAGSFKTEGDECPLNDEQKLLLKAIQEKNASYLLVGESDPEDSLTPEGGYEENVFARLKAILNAELPKSEDPLGRAARQLESLAPYQALRELADKGLSF